MAEVLVLKDGRRVDVDDIGGLAEVAERYKWNPSTLTTWVNRYTTCPKPITTLRRGALYVVSDWDGWIPGGDNGEDGAAM